MVWPPCPTERERYWSTIIQDKWCVNITSSHVIRNMIMTDHSFSITFMPINHWHVAGYDLWPTEPAARSSTINCSDLYSKWWSSTSNISTCLVDCNDVIANGWPLLVGWLAGLYWFINAHDSPATSWWYHFRFHSCYHFFGLIKMITIIDGC